MANYELVNADQLDADLTSVGNAIRAKGGTVSKLAFPSGMVQAINAISTGVELNFKLVKNPQPSNPTENTIWLDTDTPITDWYFAAEQPENMVNGSVWFPTGSYSPAAFNALKENAVQVYPLSAKQMISGELTDVPAKIYQGNNWNGIFTDFLIFESGSGALVEYLTREGSTASISTDSEKITFGYSGNTNTSDLVWYTAEKHDMSKFNTLKITVNLTAVSTSYNYVGFGLMSKVPTTDNFSAQSWVASKGIKTKGVVEYEIDIEQYNDSYYIVFCGAVCKGEITDFRACI